METAAAILDSCDNVFFQCDVPSKKELLKISFLIISFILGTVDIITDWINWNRWSSFGGYDQYYFVYIFQTAFLCAAVVGTILWTAELFLMIKRSQESIRSYQKRSSIKAMEQWKITQRSEHSSWSSRVGFTIRLLIGLMEDLPVVILLYYSMVISVCGISILDERLSTTTIAVVVSSMLNSMWTMFILYWDLFGCYKKIVNAQCCCTVIRSVYEQVSLFVCYCGLCGCAATSKCGCLCLGQSQVEKSPTESSEMMTQSRYKRIAILIGKIILLVFICLLYLGIFILSIITLCLLFNVSLPEGWGLVEAEHTRSIKADIIGPGLDARQDGAMFITMVYDLPNWYHVSLYDNRNVNIANSASVNQIQNRLCIGQFNELEHLKDGTLAKVIPCSRVFPFLEQISIE